MQVVRIDRPHGDERPELPKKSVNYHRELAERGWRKGLKPLTVQQPEGPSFTVSIGDKFHMASRVWRQAVQTGGASATCWHQAGLLICTGNSLRQKSWRVMNQATRQAQPTCEWIRCLFGLGRLDLGACCAQVDGNLIKWQKWHIRHSFNYREGLVLHDVGCASPRELFVLLCGWAVYDCRFAACADA